MFMLATCIKSSYFQYFSANVVLYVLFAMVMIRRFVVFFCIVGALFSTFPGQVSAQVQVVLRDTTVERGALARVDVRLTSLATLSLPRRIDSMRVVLRYTTGVLLRQSVQSGFATTLFNCPSPVVDSQFVSFNLGFLRISCSSLKMLPLSMSMRDTTNLFSINFLTLAAQDSVATVSVDSLIVNGRPETITVRPARITVTGGPIVVPKFNDVLGQNFPNPVTAAGTTFPYTIAESGDVQFAIFSILGEMVYEFPGVRRQQGRFALSFVPPRSLASMFYNLRMTTARGIQTIPFQIVR
jgi:hypothetical protein